MAAEAERAAPPAAPLSLVLTSALLLATQIASKATRDALFLVSFDPRRLPWMMIAGAVASLAAVAAMGPALARWGPRAVLPPALCASALLNVVEWALLHESAPAAAVLLYLHVGAIGSVLLSAFWTLVSDSGDPRVTKRRASRVTTAAAAGATVGGLVALEGVDIDAMLALIAAATLLAALTVGRESVATAPVPPPEDAPADDDVGAPVREVARSKYLRALGATCAVVAVWQALLDYAFKTRAEQTFEGAAELTAFFGLFYTVTSLIAFVIEAVIGNLALRRAGLVATLLASPAWVALGAFGLLGTPMPFVAVLRGGELVASNSLLRSGYETLFGPLPAATRRRTKSIVDVAATRAGDAAGSVLVLVLVDLDLAAPLVAAAVVALLSTLLVRAVSRGYVQALTEALELGFGAAAHEPTGADEMLSIAPAGPSEKRRPPNTSLAERARALTQSTPEALEKALAQPIEPELARLALAHLADPALRPIVEPALREVLPRSVGAIVDALLDPDVPIPVRARLPRLLGDEGEPRAIEGLLLGLFATGVEVRMQCARKLARLTEAAVDRQRVLDAILHEISRYGDTWMEATTDIPSDDEPLPVDPFVRAHASRSLQFVLVLLSVVIEADRLEHALQALSSSDPAMRGTALELLDVLVPDPVREPLLRALEAPLSDRGEERVTPDGGPASPSGSAEQRDGAARATVPPPRSTPSAEGRPPGDRARVG